MHGDQFQYLMVIPGVVAALALGRLLRGLALEFISPGVKGHWIPNVWAVVLFAMQLQYWHTTRLCAGANVNELHIYSIFLVMPIMVYFAATVLMPVNDGPQVDLDLRKHYLDHAPKFFWICFLGLLLEIVINNFVSLPCEDYGTPYDNWLWGAGACLAGVLACFRPDKYKWLHPLGAVLGAALLVAFMIVRSL